MKHPLPSMLRRPLHVSGSALLLVTSISLGCAQTPRAATASADAPPNPQVERVLNRLLTAGDEPPPSRAEPIPPAYYNSLSSAY